ncbi:hypothetical protein MLD38_032457 [Melastoma candidum]|uniref:Uncharacterized protein n=1 Tax=Melastoma candidum TaxID=119954 RepID=A0ACB9M3W8_9MYRT|nr:hypothetical protein MLD38_032457 [Melastoma candidum]
MAAPGGCDRDKPIAAFMAFGTLGDVYPIAAVAAAFVGDVGGSDYEVFFVTHAAHKSLQSHLEKKGVTFLAVSTPPVLASFEGGNGPNLGPQDLSFSEYKKILDHGHKQECLSLVETIFCHGEVFEGDFIVINFFALEGWNLAELFRVPCVVAAPYVVPYSAPSSFECQFKKEFPLVYDYLCDAPQGKVSWKDVVHWMWPLFTETWASWRSDFLNLSSIPFTDPVTGLPTWHERVQSPLLLYGFSEDIVEHPDYWPSNVRVCGFWSVPIDWQFSCQQCSDLAGLVSSEPLSRDPLCSSHVQLQSFLKIDTLMPLVFVGLSSIGSMGFLMNPGVFLSVLQVVAEITNFRFILLTAGYKPLEEAILTVAAEESSCSRRDLREDGMTLPNGRIFCFSGSIAYEWLFQRCAISVHHGGSGSTAAALRTGIPQVICPFFRDQFYWAERMFWLGVALEPLKRHLLQPENSSSTCIRKAANMFAKALDRAHSPEIQKRAAEISQRISRQDGASEAVRILKREMSSPSGG